MVGTETGPAAPARRALIRGVAALLLLALAAAGCSAGSGRPVASPTGAAASGPPMKELRAQVDALTSTGRFPGLALLVRDDDRRLVAVSGLARTQPSQTLTREHRFPVAGLTKPMVAVVALQLVDRHRLRLTEKVDHVLPGLLDEGRKITVADLLSQRSGLPDVDHDPRFADRVPAHATARQRVALVAHAPLRFPPGSSAAYSDTNDLVLGLVVEKITRRSLAAVLRSQVFQKLRMTSASLHRGSLPGAPMVHGYVGRRDVTDVPPGVGLAAGGAVMSVVDVDRFLVGLFGGRLVEDRTLAAMRASHDGRVEGWNGYGYGLAHEALRCGTAIGHSGRVAGYAAEAWTMPSRGRNVVVLANRDGGEGAGGAISGLVEDALCG